MVFSFYLCISKLIAGVVRRVDPALEIESDDLDAIEVDKRTVADSLLEVIKVWLHCANPKPTRTVLTAVTRSKLLDTEAETQSVTQVVSTQEGCCVLYL